MARAQGLRAWLIQRLSAVYMLGYFFFFLLSLSARTPHGFTEWRAFMAAPTMRVATFLVFLMLLIHAWVGMRNVTMDYLSAFKTRFAVLTLIALVLIVMGAWVLLVLARAG